MRYHSSFTQPKPQASIPMRGRPRRRFPAALVTCLALLVGSARALAGPAPAFPLEPAFELAADARPEPVPLRWAGGWMLAKVTINGADAGWFLLATGWNWSCIDPQVAARLKLPMVSRFGLMDGVNGPTPAVRSSKKRYRVDGLQCGAASATDVLLVPDEMAKMSQKTVKMYGEGISGALGWDLLRTLPFVLDAPGLRLEWQRVARPAVGATRVPMIEKAGLPFIEIMAGKGCKTLAMLNTAVSSMSIERQFLRNHAAQLWVGPVRTIKGTYYNTHIDDDGLPVGESVALLPSSRWLAVECGGLQRTLPAELPAAEINSLDEPSQGDAQFGSAWLRRLRVLFDGPGKALWLTPAMSTPEVELLRNGRPTLSPCLLEAALSMAIEQNAADAVKALAAAGADVKGSPDVTTVQALLDVGADPTILDIHGISPLAHAAAAGRTNNMAVLLAHGASPDATSPQAKPPIWVAASGGQLRAVRALLASGADPAALNPQTKTTALGVANARGDQAMVALLEKQPRKK